MWIYKAWVGGYVWVCVGVRRCVRGYAWVYACVWDEFSKFLLENRVPTSADFNTHPRRFFFLFCYTLIKIIQINSLWRSAFGWQNETWCKRNKNQLKRIRKKKCRYEKSCIFFKWREIETSPKVWPPYGMKNMQIDKGAKRSEN